MSAIYRHVCRLFAEFNSSIIYAILKRKQKFKAKWSVEKVWLWFNLYGSCPLQIYGSFSGTKSLRLGFNVKKSLSSDPNSFFSAAAIPFIPLFRNYTLPLLKINSLSLPDHLDFFIKKVCCFDHIWSRCKLSSISKFRYPILPTTNLNVFQ